MLHVHGGSVLLSHLQAAEIPGDRLEWGEALCVGPTPAGLAPDAWRATRAAFLAATSGAPSVSASLAAADQHLRLAAAEQDEIVLWYGPELFCQAILIAVLDRLSQARARLSLVSLDHYPGAAGRGCTVSYLNAAQLQEVFRSRPAVTPEQLALAQSAWRAWCSPTPERLAALVERNPQALPYLADALRRELEELPAPGSGLSRTERSILQLLGEGPREFGDLFRALGDQEERPWHTDLILLDVLRQLNAGPVPLIEAQGPWGQTMTVQQTEAGADVLAGVRDAVLLNGINRWVGGTHLTPGACWRWGRDASGTRLLAPT